LESDPRASFFITGLIVSFLLSALFASIKIVFNSIDKSTIPADDDNLRYYASKVEDILENWALFSSTIALGRTAANIIFAVFCYLYTKYLFPNLLLYQSILFPILFSTIFLSLLAYEIPRALALRLYRNYFPVVYIGYKIFGWLFLPFASFFNCIHNWLLSILKYDSKLSFLSEEDQARITEHSDTESLDEEEKEMIRSIFDLGETTVDEIMVPRIDIKGIPADTDLTSILNVIREEGHSRFPIYKESIDSIIGILYAKDILSWLSENDIEMWNLSDLLKKPHFVPVGKKVNDLMREFKKKHLHIAIVVDEYGGTAGMVTMEDILEEIVGDIQDEYDEEELEVVQIAENVYIIDPHIDLQDLNDELDITIETEEVDYTTLGGLIYHEYGDVPHENVQFEYDGLKITVLKMDNQRIEKVKVEVLQRPSNPIESNEF
jgi:CBS domain containing-hemolysin-like protein